MYTRVYTPFWAVLLGGLVIGLVKLAAWTIVLVVVLLQLVLQLMVAGGERLEKRAAPVLHKFYR